MQLLAEVRPNAVAFVDAFDYPDEVLQSCLGRYDGQVYQALYDYAKSSPMNEKEVYDIPVHEVHQMIIIGLMALIYLSFFVPF